MLRVRQSFHALHANHDRHVKVRQKLEPKSVEKPTLILAGRQDAMVGYRDAWKILENYPRGTFAVLDRAGHNLQIEQETLFNALVNEWLDRVEENLV